MISQIGQRQSASPFCSSDSLPVAVLVLPEARRNCTLFCVVVLQTVFVFALCDILVGLQEDVGSDACSRSQHFSGNRLNSLLERYYLSTYCILISFMLPDKSSPLFIYCEHLLLFFRILDSVSYWTDCSTEDIKEHNILNVRLACILHLSSSILFISFQN